MAVFAAGLNGGRTQPLNHESKPSAAWLSHHLIGVLPDDLPWIARRQHLDKKATGFESDLQSMHLTNVFGRRRFEP